VNYIDVVVRASVDGEQTVFIYFDDKSAYTTFSFNAVEPEEGQITDESEDGSEDQWDKCGSDVVEKLSPSTVVPGSTVLVYVYTNGTVSPQRSSSGAKASLVQSNIVSEEIEDVVFTDGVATLTYPVSGQAGLGDASVEVTWNNALIGDAEPNWTPGSNQLIVNKFIGDDDYYSIPAQVTYTTRKHKYQIEIPESWVSAVFVVPFRIAHSIGIGQETCDIRSLSMTIEGEGITTPEDVVIHVQDYVSDVDIDGVAIYVDGVYRGVTDASGLLTVEALTPGDHTIRMTKTGYVSSDLDDLDNDDFTV